MASYKMSFNIQPAINLTTPILEFGFSFVLMSLLFILQVLKTKLFLMTRVAEEYPQPQCELDEIR